MNLDRAGRSLAVLVIILLISNPIFINSWAAGTDGPRTDDGKRFLIEIPVSFPDPVINKEHGASKITMDGIDQERRSFALSIPVHNVPLDLPVNSKLISVTLADATTRKMDFEGDIAMNPGPVPGADPSLFEMIEEEVPPPGDHLDLDLGTGIDLDTGETVMKIKLTIFPVLPGEGDLEILDSAVIRVEYKPPAIEPLDISGEQDLLIICPDVFTEKLEEYSLYKNQTGTRTVVVNLTTIENDSIFNVSGSDIQEEIKLFIEKARSTWSIDSVMLAGDVNVMPARQIMVVDGYDDGGSTDGRFLPSDLYFADLYEGGTTRFCTWNDYTAGNHHLLWGEYNGGNDDGADLYPDVIVGRMPASDLQELSLMLEKARMYELSAMGSDWFMNSTLCGTNTFTYSGHGDTSGVNEGEMISDLIDSGPLSDFTATKHYESLGNLSQIKGTVDRGCGFFEMANHGMYNGWGYTSSGVAVTSSMAFGLDNGYKLPVAVLDACLTHGFDNENASEAGGVDPVYGYSYYPPGSSYSWRDCLGEYFHKAPDGGAVATIGCSRVGYGGHGNYHDDRYSGYMNFRIHQAYSDGYGRTGEMLAKAWEDYINFIGRGGAYNYKTLTEYLLLGDPTVSVGGVEGANMTIRAGTIGEEILPGETVSVEFNVTNSGFMSSLVEINVDLNGGEEDGWTSSMMYSNDNIGPDEVINCTMNVTAPEEVLMGSTITATIVVSSLMINDPEVLDVVFTVGREWGLEVETDPLMISTIQGSRIAGHINVTNTGNGIESFTIDFEDLPDGWVLNLGQDVYDIDPYDVDRIPFQVDVSMPCLAGTYNITINASSEIDPAFGTGNLIVEIAIENDLLLTGPGERIDITPGTTGEAVFRIENMGNSDVSVTTGWGLTYLPGWNLSMNRTSMGLTAFANGTFTVHIGVPEGMSPLTYRIFINATDGVVTRSTSLVINVSRVYDYTAICHRTVKNRSNGATTFEIEITNHGNIYDLFRVTGKNMTGEWSFSASPADLSVDPGEKKTVYVSLSSIFPLKGNYSFLVLVSPQSESLPTTIRLTIVVEGIHDLELDMEMNETGALPGEGIAGVLKATSLSNCVDSYSIETILPSGFDCTGLNETLTIPPGEMMEMDFNICMPVDGLAGTYTILFRLTSTESSLNRTVSRTVRILEVYDVRMSYVSGIEEEMVPGRTYELVFEIFNNGNTDDNVRFELNASEYIMNWLRMESRSISGILPGSTVNLSIYLTIPSWNVTGGHYNLSLRASSLGMEIGIDNMTLSVKSSDDDTDREDNTNWTLISMIIIAAVIIIITALIIGFIFIRKRSGEDIEDLGMEWEEEDDLWDEDEEDWDWDDE